MELPRASDARSTCVLGLCWALPLGGLISRSWDVYLSPKGFLLQTQSEFRSIDAMGPFISSYIEIPTSEPIVRDVTRSSWSAHSTAPWGMEDSMVSLSSGSGLGILVASFWISLSLNFKVTLA